MKRTQSVEDDPKKRFVYDLEVSELRVPLNNSTVDSKIKEGRDDIRRFFFVKQNEIISFGAIFDEYPSRSVTYVSFLEKTGFGSSVCKGVLRSYAEYVSCIANGWVLHIWADAIGPEDTYIFANAKHVSDKSLKERSKELKDMYQVFLKQSSFSSLPYRYVAPPLPHLPTFGKKRSCSRIFRKIEGEYGKRH